jgi:hypothetical protein
MFYPGDTVMFVSARDIGAYPTCYRYITRLQSEDGAVVRHLVAYTAHRPGVEIVVSDGEMIGLVGLRFLAAGEQVYSRSDDQDHSPQPYAVAVGITGEEKAERARFIAAVLQTHAEVAEAYPSGIPSNV